MMPIALANGAAAFLRHGDKYLLMKRAPNRKAAPDVWSGVGGHMECDELNDPQAACLREVDPRWRVCGCEAFPILSRAASRAAVLPLGAPKVRLASTEAEVCLKEVA